MLSPLASTVTENCATTAEKTPACQSAGGGLTVSGVYRTAVSAGRSAPNPMAVA
ncbi:hypothetical protein M2359_003359 [Gordonia amarae]|nr:hypothetical protein [Gordonia amarae]